MQSGEPGTIPVWSHVFGPNAKTVIVVPSIDYDVLRYEYSPGVEHLEERMLFTLFWLARSRLQLIYVTSTMLDPSAIAYYLRYLPDADDARSRVRFLTINDESHRPLAAKLLERPDHLDDLRALILDPESTRLLPFKVTHNEIALAQALGLRLAGPSRDALYLGTKSGARLVADIAGASLPDGDRDLRSVSDVNSAIGALLERYPQPEAVVLKLNKGVGGVGNAIVERPRIPLDESQIAFGSSLHDWTTFQQEIERQGAVVEELIRGPGIVSPSVQMVIGPDATSHEISTHDQVLGDPEHQTYQGCRFPADPAYRNAIRDEAERIAKVLSSRGVVGFFSVDLIVGPQAPQRLIYICEINLRMSATTLPYFTAQALTRGIYEDATGDLIAAGRAKYYFSTDNLRSDAYIGLSPEAAIEAIDRNDLGFDKNRGTGVALHMLGALRRYGRVGVTCIGDSPGEPDTLYRETQTALGGGRLPRKGWPRRSSRSDSGPISSCGAKTQTFADASRIGP